MISSLDERLLLIQASVYSNKASIDSNKEYFDDKMKKLREIFDKIIENVDHLFHNYWISSQDNDVEDDGILVITKSTSKTKLSESYPSSFRKPTQLTKVAHFRQLISLPCQIVITAGLGGVAED